VTKDRRFEAWGVVSEQLKEQVNMHAVGLDLGMPSAYGASEKRVTSFGILQCANHQPGF